MSNYNEFKTLLDEKIELEKTTRIRLWHLAILLLSLMLTLFSWYIAKSQVDEKIKNQFEVESERVVDQIIERLQIYEDTLWSGVAAIKSQSFGIDYNEWKRFANALHIEDRYQGINGIGVIYRFPNDEKLNEFNEDIRRFQPEFQVYPPHDAGEYWPIVYIEPLESNKKAQGLDMAHEENRFTAAKKSRDTGTAQITGPITLVQDSESTPGFLFYVPFYEKDELYSIKSRQEHFIGLVYAPFIFKKLMQGTLQKEKRHVGISISDGGEMLYNEHRPDLIGYDESPRFTKQVTKEIYGRQWVFDIHTVKTFDGLFKSNQPTYILVGGLLIEIILILLFIYITKLNARALRFTDKMVEGYRNTNENLKEAQNFQHRVLENIPDFIFVKDEDGRIVTCNKAFLSIYPKEKRDKVIGYTTVEDFDKDEAEKFLYHDRKALESGYSETIEQVMFPNGENLTLFTKKIGFEDRKGQKFLLGIARNITEMKRTEEKLMHSNLELERFAYVAAHDMQEPVRMVKSFAEILMDDKKDMLDEEGISFLKECVKGANRIQDIINDLLDYSKVSNIEDELQAVDMEELYAHVLDNLKLKIQDTKAEVVKKDKLPVIKGSPERCVRLFENILLNAFKYQPDGQIPYVTISLDENSDSYIFRVKDNGIGINEKYHEKIFEPFKKLHHYSRYEGTGIGLSICMKIVKTMGGELWVDSEEGKGATFNIQLLKWKEYESD